MLEVLPCAAGELAQRAGGGPLRWLQRLAARQPVEACVALLAAHPDDEVIGAGASLHLFRRLILVHLTDGAPTNLADTRAHGFADAASYAAARREELARALCVAGVAPVCIELGAPDQGASLRLADLVRVFRACAAEHRVEAVFTHPYEGGHPDHDAAAFVAAASGLPVIEFASYHAGPDGMVTGAFLPGPAATRIDLTPEDSARKRAMLDCFTTQRATLAPFGTAYESFRPAPSYDFTQPPHPGTPHYERYDWGMTGARWRSLAGAARC